MLKSLFKWRLFKNMGILNSTNEGHCELIFAVIKLIANKPMDLSKITLLLNPEKAHLNPNHKARGTITTWTKLGLFEQNGDKIDLSQNAKSFLKKIDNFEFENKVSYLIRRTLFSSKKNETDTIWSNESANDFYRALSWMLIQNPFSFCDFSYDTCDRLYKEQQSIKDESKEIIQGQVRLRGFLPYARFSGFFSGTSVGGSKSFDFIDPTNAIQQDLDLIIKPDEEMELEDFLQKLSSELPVFDGGKYRIQVEQILDKKFYIPLESRTISSSLSLALKRLEQLGVIRLISKGDAKSSFNLTMGTKLNKVLQYSHIKRNNG